MALVQVSCDQDALADLWPSGDLQKKTTAVSCSTLTGGEKQAGSFRMQQNDTWAECYLNRIWLNLMVTHSSILSTLLYALHLKECFTLLRAEHGRQETMK